MLQPRYTREGTKLGEDGMVIMVMAWPCRRLTSSSRKRESRKNVGLDSANARREGSALFVRAKERTQPENRRSVRTKMRRVYYNDRRALVPLLFRHCTHDYYAERANEHVPARFPR